MTKSPHAFRSIGEVARLVGVATHVLRYWETQFTALRPVKRADGRRHYRPDDVLLVAGICEALHEEGLTIRGARRLIAMDGGAGLRARGAGRLARTGIGRGDDPAQDGSIPLRPDNALPDPLLPAASPPETSPPDSSPVAPSPPALSLPAAVPPHLSRPDAPPPGPCLLERLCATADALRDRRAPLPPRIAPVVAALRTARGALADSLSGT